MGPDLSCSLLKFGAKSRIYITLGRIDSLRRWGQWNWDRLRGVIALIADLH